jgi:TDG/mug DNA glycosylase family protein
MDCQSFAPITREDARILILGSMPSIMSLRKQQYYGHPQNHFWPIIYSLLELPLPSSYEQRVQGAINHHIAIWDVAASCEREGSSDSAIRNETVNDFQNLLLRLPQLQLICFNGTKARDLWKKHVGDIAPITVDFVTLPSSSPIPTRNIKTLPQKIAAWMIIKEYL